MGFQPLAYGLNSTESGERLDNTGIQSCSLWLKQQELDNNVALSGVPVLAGSTIR